MLSNIIYNVPYILFFVPILFSIGTCLVESKRFNVFSILGTLSISALFLLISLFKVSGDNSLFMSISGVESLIGGEFRINSVSILFSLILTMVHIFVFLNTNYEFLKIDKKKDISYRKYFFMTYLLNIFSLFGLIFTSDVCNYFIFLELYSFTLYIISSDYKDKKNLKNSFSCFLNSICGSVVVLLSIFFLCLFFNSHRMVYIMQRFLTTNVLVNKPLLFISLLFFTGLMLKFFSLDIIFYKGNNKRNAGNLLSFLILFVNNTLSMYSILYFLKYLFNIDYVFDIVQVKMAIVVLGMMAVLYSCYSIVKYSTLYNFVKKATCIYMSLVVICIGLNDKYSTYLALLFIFEHLTSDFMVYLVYDYLVEKYNSNEVDFSSDRFSKMLFVFLLCLKIFLPIGVLYCIHSVVLFNLSGYNRYVLLVPLIVTKISYLLFFFRNFDVLKIDQGSIEYNSDYNNDTSTRKIKILKYSMLSVFIIIVVLTFFVSHIKAFFI